MSRTTRHLVLALSAVLLVASGAGASSPPARVVKGASAGRRSRASSPYAAQLGPDRGGRSIAISGVKGRPRGLFRCDRGGLWKTIDRGESWVPVTDGQIHSLSVGAAAVSETSPDSVDRHG
jgi:hypothetical protein